MNDDRVARMRAAMWRMLIGVVVVDAMGLAVFLLTPLTRTPNGRTAAGLFWIVATLAVILPGLRDIRTARRS